MEAGHRRPTPPLGAHWHGRFVARAALRCVGRALLLAVAALLVCLVLDGIQLAQPGPSRFRTCGGKDWGNRLLHPGGTACSSGDSAPWAYNAATDRYLPQATRRITIREVAAGTPRALQLTAEVSLDSRSSLVSRVRDGELADRPEKFVDAVFTYLDFGLSPHWTSPVVTESGGSGARRATITVVGRLSSADAAELGRLTVSVFAEGTAAVAVDVLVPHWRLVGVRGGPELQKTGQTPTSLAGTFTDTLQFQLSDGSPQSAPANPGFTGGRWRSALVALAAGFVAVPAWLVLLYLGALRRWPPSWIRFLRILAGVIVIHLILAGYLILDTAESLILAHETNPSAATLLTRFLATGSRSLPYVAVSGPQILFAALAVFLVPRWAALIRPDEPTPSRRRPGVVVPLVLTLSAVVWWLVARRLANHDHDALSGVPPAVGAERAAVVTVGAFAALLVLVLVLRRPLGVRDRSALPLLVCCLVSLATLAPIQNYAGMVPVALGYGVTMGAGAAVLVALARLTMETVTRRRPARATLVLIAAVCLVAAFPLEQSRGGQFYQWLTVITILFRIDGLLALVLLVALPVALRDRAGRGSHQSLRLVGVGCGFVVLSGSYSFIADPSLAGVATAAVAAVVLLPRSKVESASLAARLTPAQRAAAIRGVVRLAAGERTWAAVHKGLRAKVAADEIGLDAANAKIREAERQAGIGTPGRERVTRIETAFASFSGGDAWARARWGTFWGSMVGLPWMVISTFAAVKELPTNDSYPVLASVAALTPVLLPWPAYGFFYGYFFPVLRGRTGLGKATTMMALALAASVAGTIAAGEHGRGWSSITLAAVQMLVFAVVLGLRADGDILEHHGRRRADLADLHNLGPATAVGSAVVIAVVTAVLTTVLAGSLQPFLSGLTQPVPAPSRQTAPSPAPVR